MLAVIPLRGFDSAKTRLAAEMSATDRARIAAAVAGSIWTYDGRPYQRMSWEGSCAPDKPLSCRLR